MVAGIAAEAAEPLPRATTMEPITVAAGRATLRIARPRLVELAAARLLVSFIVPPCSSPPLTARRKCH